VKASKQAQSFFIELLRGFLWKIVGTDLSASCLKGHAARLFVPAAHAPEMARGAFFKREVGGTGQATHNLAFLFGKFAPRAQAVRRVAAGASGVGRRCHRANINMPGGIRKTRGALKRRGWGARGFAAQKTAALSSGGGLCATRTRPASRHQHPA
jgi:hypothetical protein